MENLSTEQSLRIISETLDQSRRTITRNSGSYFILWGTLLTLFSLLVYILWKTSGSPAWNYLWFAMPVIGYPLSFLLQKKKEAVPDNLISKLIAKTWTIFGVFALSVSSLILVCSRFSEGMAGLFMVVGITPAILMLFGISESFSGVLLKNRIVIAGGILVGIGGLLLYYLCGLEVEQMLIFTFAGVILALTGVLTKYQNR